MIVLKNATIYNGSTDDAFKGSVIIDGDTIIDIIKGDDKIRYKGDIVDCSGLSLAPGFIDAHSHNDFFAGRENNLKYFKPFIEQGVTTQVVGNCGFSAAGYKTDTIYNDKIGGGLFSNAGANYSSFKNWSEKINHNMPVNMVCLEGHGTARIGINGMDSNELNAEQLKELENDLDKALREGACGVSFGLMYQPGQFAPREELELVAKVVKKHNKVLTFHSRALSKVSTSYSPPIGGRAHNLRALDEVIEICKKIGVKTQFSHLIFVGEKSWATATESLKLLEQTKAQGYDIMFDTYPMEFGASIITVVLPTWYLGLSASKKKSAITKLRLSVEIGVTKKALGFGFEDILISNTHGILPEIEGKRINEIAKLWGKSELNTYLEIVDKTDAKAGVLMYRYANEEIINKLRVHPQAMYMTDSWIEDGGVQNFACFYTFPKFLCLAKKNGTSIPLAINKMSGLIADRFGFANRGYIKKNFKADITIFDLNELAYEENTENKPKGIKQVYINGVKVVDKGILTDKAKKAGEFVKV